MRRSRVFLADDALVRWKWQFEVPVSGEQRWGPVVQAAVFFILNLAKTRQFRIFSFLDNSQNIFIQGTALLLSLEGSWVLRMEMISDYV